MARERASRFAVDYDSGVLRETRHGQLVADWVELFAPVVFEPHRPQAWPSAGSLVIDSLPFRVRNPLQPGRAAVAFSVFCAYSSKNSFLIAVKYSPPVSFCKESMVISLFRTLFQSLRNLY